MKKLGICLLALAMVLGFASCNKDAETEEGWSEKALYITWEQMDSEDDESWVATDVSFTEKEGIEPTKVFVRPVGGIKKAVKWEKFLYDLSKQTYSDTPANSDEQDIFFDELEINTCPYSEGIFQGYMYIMADPDDSLKPKKYPYSKTIYTFDDNSTLTYYNGFDEAVVKPLPK